MYKANSIEVLAQVPSYEEWQETLQALDAAHKAIKMEDETINRLVCSGKQCNYEKRKLKQLLKECRECVDENLEFSQSIGRNRIQPRNKGLLKRIDEVLKCQKIPLKP